MDLQAKKSSKAKEDVEEEADDGEINVAGGCLDAADNSYILSQHIDPCLCGLMKQADPLPQKSSAGYTVRRPEIASACACPWSSRFSAGM